MRITGRKKEILVTAGGKNVAPAVLEDRVRGARPGQPVPGGRRRSALHRGAGHHRPEDAFPAWAKARGKSGRVADLVDDPDLRAEIESAVEEANRAVSKAESIRKFRSSPTTGPRRAGSSPRA